MENRHLACLHRQDAVAHCQEFAGTPSPHSISRPAFAGRTGSSDALLEFS
jgi:hypothetical protein